MSDQAVTPESIIGSYERLVEMSKQMTPEERDALQKWEQENLGKGTAATSDWPGWPSVISRLSH